MKKAGCVGCVALGHFLELFLGVIIIAPLSLVTLKVFTQFFGPKPTCVASLWTVVLFTAIK